MGKVIQFPQRGGNNVEPVKGAHERDFTIMVVEDQDSLREVIGIYLRRYGYHIRSVDTGEEALKVLAAEKINLVLLDLMLPGMDGFELLRRLRQRSSNHLPYIMVVSARATEEDRKKVLELGGNEVFPKPIQLASLVERIETLENNLN